LLYLPTGTANIFLTLPMSVNVDKVIRRINRFRGKTIRNLIWFHLQNNVTKHSVCDRTLHAIIAPSAKPFFNRHRIS
jgi:hypothetical protein